MTPLAFVLACLALLVTPGPTNTLIALRAVQGGIPAALRLMPAELAGYALAVVPLALFGQAVLADLPALAAGLQIVAALWVALLAVRLWRPVPPGAAQGGVSARQVFLTTLLNPKALVFGLVLFPGTAAPLPVLLILFGLSIGAVACLWAVAAQVLARGRPALLRRAASAVLMLFAALLAQTGLAGPV
jgi:threonine/homoserine/homoserine lactone efflux protein